MRKGILLLSVSIFLLGIIYSGCRKDEPVFDLGASKYPAAVGNIIMTTCAVSGCHNTQSKDACAGLDLSSWDKMMEGDRNGAVCIPYSADFSTMFLFTNTYMEMGAMVTPTMPSDGSPLTKQQETVLRDWINAGAPDASGFVKWSDNPNRKKYYITLQGCDKVCTVDAETNLQMRYISVGASSAVEQPHNIKISPDGQYWCVSFLGGLYLEKHRTSDDAFVSRILLGPDATSAVGSWNTFSFSPDGHYAWAVDWELDGKQAWVDLQTNTWRQTYQGSGWTTQPHGSAVTPDGNFLYLTCLVGNYIHKMDVSIPTFPQDNQIEIDGLNIGAQNNNTVCTHDVLLSPDGTKAFFTAQLSNMIKVVSVHGDSLLASIPVGVYPQEMAISSDPSTPYLYVTCMEDTLTYPGNRGSVYVINYLTNTVVTHVNAGWQPHGITVNDDQHIVLVADRNQTANGPAPHHATSCAGRNGYFTLIDMNSNTVITGSKTELIVDPYSAAYRR